MPAAVTCCGVNQLATLAPSSVFSGNCAQPPPLLLPQVGLHTPHTQLYSACDTLNPASQHPTVSFNNPTLPVNPLLPQVGLLEQWHSMAGELSGGQRRKLSVAIAFLGSPGVVVLDEPTSGMDPASRRATWQVIRSRWAMGGRGWIGGGVGAYTVCVWLGAAHGVVHSS